MTHAQANGGAGRSSAAPHDDRTSSLNCPITGRRCEGDLSRTCAKTTVPPARAGFRRTRKRTPEPDHHPPLVNSRWPGGQSHLSSRKIYISDGAWARLQALRVRRQTLHSIALSSGHRGGSDHHAPLVVAIGRSSRRSSTLWKTRIVAVS